jgi:flagellar protein FliO/FliZ
VRQQGLARAAVAAFALAIIGFSTPAFSATPTALAPATVLAPATASVAPSPAAIGGADFERSIAIPSPGSQVASGGAGLGAWDFLSVLLVLGFVLLLIYGVFRLIKRGTKQKELTSPVVRVLGTATLAQGRYVHVVKAGPQVFLVGSGEGSVCLLGEITDKETIDTIQLAAEAEEASPKKDFSNILGIILGGGKIAKSKGLGSSPLDGLKRQRDRLRKF